MPELQVGRIHAGGVLMNPTTDMIFTIAASGALVLMCAISAATLPWTDAELDETAEAFASLWAWLTGTGSDE